MGMMGEPDAPPPAQRPGMGDHTTAMLVAGSTAMALLHRQRTGEGQQVDVSLHNTGLWVLGIDVQTALVSKTDVPRVSRKAVPNPLWNTYETKDFRWIMCVMLVSDAYWPQFCRAIEREDLEKDERFASFAERSTNNQGLIAILDHVFATRTFRSGGSRLDAEGLIWRPRRRDRGGQRPAGAGAAALRGAQPSDARPDPPDRHAGEVQPLTRRRPRLCTRARSAHRGCYSKRATAGRRSPACAKKACSNTYHLPPNTFPNLLSFLA
jgi:hypothetical protein